MSQQLRGMILVITAAVLWSTGGLFIKKITVDPLTITCLRSAIAGLVLLPFLKPKQIRFNKYLLGYVCSYSWLVIAFVTATKLTSAANAIALQYTAPLYIFIFSVWMREVRVNWRTLSPIVLICAGILFFLLEPSRGSSLAGNIWGISSGVALALANLSVSRLKEAPAINLVCLANLTAAIVVLPFLPDHTVITRIDLSGWLSLAYLGALQIALAHVLFVSGIKHIHPLQATVLALTEAILNPIWVAVFWGEIPSAHGLAGAVLILLAVLADVYLKRGHVSGIIKTAD